MQKTHRVLNLVHLLFAKLSRVVFVIVSFEIKHVSLYDQLGSILNLLQILDPFTLFLVTALSTLGMLVLNIICQTQPAKLVLTFEACHMITTLVFLD
jgi:hypothetical protein